MVDSQHDLRDRLAGCVYGAIIGDIFREINQETLVPVFGSEFSLDMQDCLRYMEGYVTHGMCLLLWRVSHTLSPMQSCCHKTRTAMVRSWACLRVLGSGFTAYRASGFLLFQ